ncbi:hypothetical protein [Arcticibacter tournemirensis]
MNSLFNLRRFAMLFKKHTLENFRYYMMSLVVLLGIMSLFFLFTSMSFNGRHISIPVETQFSMFTGLFLLGGTIFTSTVFSDLAGKKRAIFSLTLPVTYTERFLIGWVYSAIVYPVMFAACFYFVDWLFLFVINQWPGANFVNVFSAEKKFYLVFVIYAALQAISLWGAVFFDKYQFIKTAFVFFVFVFVLNLFNKGLLSLLIRTKGSTGLPFSDLSLENFNYGRVALDAHVHNIYLVSVVASITILFWLAALLRVKEKEV